MSDNNVCILNGHQTAEARWARFGLYYAVLPLDFTFDVAKKYSRKGDCTIDPLVGRCSDVFAGGVLGHVSLGAETNPVGWLYGKAKLKSAFKHEVLTRLNDIYSRHNYFSQGTRKMPRFYRICFCDEVLRSLLVARKCLDREENNIGAALISIILVYLHGKLGEDLSNQIRVTKSVGVAYSVEWWEQ